MPMPKLLIILIWTQMLNSFPFSPAQSLFFLWLNEQNQGGLPQSTLPVSPAAIPQLEKTIAPVPLTSSSEGEEVPEPSCPATVDKAPRQRTRTGGPARARDEEVDRDYHDPCFNPKKQKKNRNVLSNLVHHLLKYLSGKQMVAGKLQAILRYHQMEITVQEFYRILEYFDDKLSSYVTEKNFKTILMGAPELAEGTLQRLQEFSKLIRILSYKFYKEECISSVIHSNKLSYESKKLHFQGLKDILQIIESLGQPELPPAPKAKKSK